MRPSKIFILGDAFRTISETAYFIGLPIFLWHFMVEKSQFNSGFIAEIIALSFFIIALTEIFSSHAADSLGFTRRKIFLLGFLLMGLGFVILALFPYWIHSHFTVLIAYALMRTVYGFGIAFISGTLDGWAISLEHLDNPDFNKSEMFALAHLWSRFISFVVGILIIVFLFAFEFGWLDLSYKVTFWVSVWLISALVLFLSFIFLKFITREAPVIETETKSAPFLSLVKVSFSKEFLPAFSLTTSGFLLSMIVTWTWPVLLESVAKPPYIYLFIILILTTSFLASLVAKKLAKISTKESSIATARNNLFLGSLILLTVSFFLFFKETESLLLSVLLIFGVAMTMFFKHISSPFLHSLLHEEIQGHEESRSTIISIRVATEEMIVALFFLGMGFVVNALNLTAGRSAAFGLLLVSVIILTFSFLVKKKVD